MIVMAGWGIVGSLINGPALALFANSIPAGFFWYKNR